MALDKKDLRITLVHGGIDGIGPCKNKTGG